MPSLTFVEMTVESDFDQYETMSSLEMTAEDLVSGAELSDWIAQKTARAWWVHGPGDELVGWCSVMIPSTCHPSLDAVHLLGNIVFGDFKGRGIGRGMTDWRVAQFKERPLTASVRPGNVPSEKILQGVGFRPGLPEQGGPWTVWHRPPDGTMMALVRWQDQDGIAERHLRDCVASDVIRGLREVGWYVEADRPPAIRQGCPHALWPDAAAFHAVVDVA